MTGTDLDVKRSSYKKLLPFLQELQRRALLELKLADGVATVLLINTGNRELRAYQPYPASETAEAAEGVDEGPSAEASLSVSVVYATTAETRLVFAAVAAAEQAAEAERRSKPHEHPVALTDQGAGWRCDVCLASNPAGRYRCTQGCDYDVCEACRARVAAQPEPEPAGAAAPAQAAPSSFLALQQEQEEQTEAEQNQTAALADVATKPHYTAEECAAALQAYCRLRPASAQNKKIIALDDLLRRALYSTGEPDPLHSTRGGVSFAD